jgi:minor extracellular serine protease Vpr
MKKFLSVLTVVFIAAAFLVGNANANINKISPDIDVGVKEPVHVIIELRDTPVAAYKKSFRYNILSVVKKNLGNYYEAKLRRKQENIAKEIHKLGGEVHFSYTYVFNGFSCTISGDKLKSVATLREVKRIYPDKKAYLQREDADRVIQADKVHELIDKNGNYITGKGIVVGIVDTGIDYNDAELGGGGFPNSKVIGGYDFADNDNDPMDEDGHGTHVAGIIAGSKYGVAPDAKIRAYKVFSGIGDSTSTSFIIQGIDQAVKDKCNIINISIGTVQGEGNGSDPESVAVKNAVQSGIVVVAAAGNTGGRSDILPFPMSSPGSNKYAIGVGASDDSTHGVITINGNSITAQYPAESPYFSDGTYTLVYCGYGKKTDFADRDVKGKIALVKRGDIYFGDKDLNARKAGAIGVICFNSVAGLPNIKLISETNPDEKDFIPFLFISNANGKLIEKYLMLTNKVTISKKYGLGGIASFSSNGPTVDFYLKPDLVAPGVNIKSTVLNNKLERWSGTSMASPFVAGCAALLKQAKPALPPGDIKALLMNTSNILINPDSGKPFSPFIQGAGRVNIYNAVNSEVVISPPSVMFGSGEKNFSQKFTVKNLTSNVFVLSLSEKIFSNEKINVDIPSSIVVSPSGSTTFIAKFSVKNSVSGNVFGNIYISGSDIILHIPFAYVPEFKIPEPLENVRTSSGNLTPNSPITLNFTVGVGAQTTENNVEYTENVAEEVKVNIFNGKGKLVETVFDRSPLYLGQYSVKIEAKDNEGNYIFKNGTYFYKVLYIEPNDDEGSKKFLSTVVKAEKTGSFNVSGMPDSSIYIIPEGGKTLLLEKGEDFWVDMRLALKEPIINLQATVVYDPVSLRLLDAEKSDNVEYNSFSYSVDTGVVHLSASGNFDKNSTVFRLHFMAMDDAEDSVMYFKSVSYYPMSENVVLPTLPFKIGSYARPWDIDNNKIVNSNDFVILKKSFGLTDKDEKFDSRCDFNKDGAVDSDDFFNLSRHFGEVYP